MVCTVLRPEQRGPVGSSHLEHVSAPSVVFKVERQLGPNKGLSRGVQDPPVP